MISRITDRGGGGGLGTVTVTVLGGPCTGLGGGRWRMTSGGGVFGRGSTRRKTTGGGTGG